MESAAQAIFWLSVAALCYTYAGYPLLLWVVSALRPRAVRRAAEGELTPGVSVVITAYNEERDLRAKLENTLALDYPPDKLEIIVASDCSTDRTDEIARAFAARGVRLLRQPERLGKTAAQNAAVSEARGEIILFSDATTHYQPDALRLIVRNFADPTVGCVAGRLVYVDPSQSGVGRGARSYWGYESFLKQHESRVGSLIGASGCLYAVRRAAYVPLYHEACSDFIIATKMVEQGLRAIYEPEAVCTEETNRRADKELRMRVRVIAQTYTDLWRHRAMLNPLRSGFYAAQLLSHKVMRYAVPLFLVACLLSSAWLAPRSLFFAVVLLAQICFYLAALTGWALERAGTRRSRLLALPHYFVLANLAALIAGYKFLRGERYARWEPIREPANSAPAHCAAGAANEGRDRDSVVSVIIPAYNCAAHIGETLASVFAQTYAADEVIVVNDGSPDTEELERALAPYRERIVYLKQENRGPSGARNAALLRARGEYVAFLDGDDLWLPDYLMEQVKALRADPTLDLIYTDALLFGDSPLAGRTFMQAAPSRGAVTLESLLLFRCSVLTSCAVARRQALLEAGLFDEGFRRAEDYDLWLRLAHKGGRLAYQTRALGRHRLHATSLAANATRMIESRSEVLRKIARLPHLAPRLRELAEAQAAQSEAELALEQSKQHLLAAQYDAAAENLARANRAYRRLTLRLALVCLRVAPGLLRRAYMARHGMRAEEKGARAGGAPERAPEYEQVARRPLAANAAASSPAQPDLTSPEPGGKGL